MANRKTNKKNGQTKSKPRPKASPPVSGSGATPANHPPIGNESPAAVDPSGSDLPSANTSPTLPSFGSLIELAHSDESTYKHNMAEIERLPSNDPRRLYRRTQAGAMRSGILERHEPAFERLRAVCRIAFGTDITLEALRRIHAALVLAGRDSAAVDALPIADAADGYHRLIVAPPTENHVTWSVEDTPSRWAKKFGISVDTFKRRVKVGKIRAIKLSDRSYKVDLHDLPGAEKSA